MAVHTTVSPWAQRLPQSDGHDRTCTKTECKANSCIVKPSNTHHRHQVFFFFFFSFFFQVLAQPHTDVHTHRHTQPVQVHKPCNIWFTWSVRVSVSKASSCHRGRIRGYATGTGRGGKGGKSVQLGQLWTLCCSPVVCCCGPTCFGRLVQQRLVK